VLFVAVPFDVELVGDAVGKLGKTLVVFGNVEGIVMVLVVGTAVCTVVFKLKIELVLVRLSTGIMEDRLVVIELVVTTVLDEEIELERLELLDEVVLLVEVMLLVEMLLLVEVALVVEVALLVGFGLLVEMVDLPDFTELLEDVVRINELLVLAEVEKRLVGIWAVPTDSQELVKLAICLFELVYVP